MNNYKKGNIVSAVVSGITDYGIFVNLDENYTGLIHISQISNGFVKDPNYFVEVDEIIDVEILDIDIENRHLRLSIKNNEYRKNGKKRLKIIETKNGFKTLESRLSYWIKENIYKQHNKKV